MRINSGLYRGRKLILEGKAPIRPSLSRVRKMVFDTLGGLIRKRRADLKILDIFAGSGAYGFEALSIFGGEATFMEMERNFCQSIKKSAETLGLKSKINVFCGNALISLNKIANDPQDFNESRKIYSLVFIDPPYSKEFLIKKSLKKLMINGNIDENSYIVVETSVYNNLDFIPDGFKIVKNKKTANTTTLILQLEKDFYSEQEDLAAEIQQQSIITDQL